MRKKPVDPIVAATFGAIPARGRSARTLPSETTRRTTAQLVREAMQDPAVVKVWNDQAARLVQARHLSKRQSGKGALRK